MRNPQPLLCLVNGHPAGFAEVCLLKTKISSVAPFYGRHSGKNIGTDLCLCRISYNSRMSLNILRYPSALQSP